MHFDLTWDRPANRPLSGFDYLHRNLSHTKSMAFSKCLALALRNRYTYFLMWTYLAIDWSCVYLSKEKRKEKY